MSLIWTEECLVCGGRVPSGRSHGTWCIPKSIPEPIVERALVEFDKRLDELREETNKKTRFTLEEQILDCNNVCEDIETIFHATDGATEDELANALMGLSQLYRWKFDKLRETFNMLIKQGDLK